jgi:hypothetical protein
MQGETTMRYRHRPGGATCIAFFHIALGGIGMFWFAYRLLLFLVGDGLLFEFQGNLALEAFLQEEVSSYKAIKVVSLCLSLLDSVLMLVCGIALLNDQNWGRLFALLLALLALLATLAETVYYYSLVVPLMQRGTEILALGQEGEFMMRFDALWTGFMNLMAFLYFLVTILVLLSRPVADFYRVRAYSWTEEW